MFTLVSEMLSLMVDLEDDENWSFSDDIEDTDMDRYRNSCYFTSDNVLH